MPNDSTDRWVLVHSTLDDGTRITERVVVNSSGEILNYYGLYVEQDDDSQWDWGTFEVSLDCCDIGWFNIDAFEWRSDFLTDFADVIGGATAFWADAGYVGEYANTGQLEGTPAPPPEPYYGP